MFKITKKKVQKKEKQYKVTSFDVKKYPSNIELFVYDDDKKEYFVIHFDLDFVKNKYQIKDIIQGYFTKESKWSSNKRLSEMVDKVFWYIKK